jgi:hypothetical protein
MANALQLLSSSSGDGFALTANNSQPFHQLISARGRAGQASLGLPQAGSKSTEDKHRVRASIACSQSQIHVAAGLVRERYAWRGYAIREDSQTIPPQTGPDGVILVAEEGGITVGTLTVGLDGPLGLRCDQSYPDEVGAVRSEGRRVCEVTRLALAERADSPTVLSVLFGLAYAIGTALSDMTDVFIEVNPRHAAFYRRVMGFVVESGERLCERVQAPAVLLRLSRDELQTRLQVHLPPAGNLATALSAL